MIPEDLWLHRAKRLPVGQSERIRHLNERRPNLCIGNAVDRWWCYCQACKQGGVVQKTHVRLDVSPERTRSNLTLPNDMRTLEQCELNVQAAITMFLHSKGMDFMYLPPLWYSESRKRLLMQHTRHWLGRDVTGDALEKWLTYNGALYLHSNRYKPVAVVVEDAFSFYKVSWACPEVDVYCALGTQIKDALVVLLKTHQEVRWMFDGDPAGYHGARKGAQRMRGLGVHSYECCAPPMKDPKDLTVQQIRNNILGDDDARHACSDVHSTGTCCSS